MIDNISNKIRVCGFSLAILFASAINVFACGPQSDCIVSGGSYRIRLPEHPQGTRIGAIVYFHGWQGSAVDGMEDQRLSEIAQNLGVALVAPNGEGMTWSFPSAPHHHRDEFAFVNAVLNDITSRFPIDPKRLLATGFSQGGSMVWYLACRMPERFAAFAPESGAFWLPAPETCKSPAPAILHLHGLSDTLIPLQGRRLSASIKQGDVRASFKILDGLCPLRPAPSVQIGENLKLTCERSNPCNNHAIHELCLHTGGHVFFPDWVAHAWKAASELGLL